jgi:hypothetical protein
MVEGLVGLPVCRNDNKLIFGLFAKPSILEINKKKSIFFDEIINKIKNH